MWGRTKQSQVEIVDFAPRLKRSTADSRARGILCEYEGCIGKIPYVVSCRDKGAKATEFRIFAFRSSRIQFAAVLDFDRDSDACSVALCLAEAVHLYGFKRIEDEPKFWFWSSLLTSCVKVMTEGSRNETGNIRNL